ncbi:MAG: hypothetical protein HQK76_05550 [Desulfobacterales bacterium]|nr:hypothetical protein [Desulfobacterales bacterium]
MKSPKKVNLYPNNYSCSGSNYVFEPLSLIKKMFLIFDDPILEVVENAFADLKIHLKKGQYNIPISKGSPCLIEIKDGFVADGKIIIEREILNGNSIPIIREFEVKFNTPIIFHNIITALLEINKTFSDDSLAKFIDNLSRFYLVDLGKTYSQNIKSTILSKIENSPLKKGTLLRNTIDKGISIAGNIVEENANKLAKVFLKGAKGQLKKSGNKFYLALFFTGSVHYLDMIPFQFNEFNLPAIILPFINASISEFFTKNPIASGELLIDNIPVKRLIETLIDALDVYKGRFYANSNFPLINFDAETSLKGLIETNIESANKLSLKGDFSGQSIDKKIAFKIENLDISVPQISDINEISCNINISNPISKAMCFLPIRIKNPTASGSFSILTDILMLIDEKIDISSESCAGNFSFETRLLNTAVIETSIGVWTPEIRNAIFEGQLECCQQRGRISATGTGDVSLNGISSINALPELSITTEKITTNIEASFKINLNAQINKNANNQFEIDLRNTILDIDLKEFIINIDKHIIYVPANADLHIEITKGDISVAGIKEFHINLKWNFNDVSPILKSDKGDVALLSDDILKGEFTIVVGQHGSLTFTGKQQKGFYDSGFFNAILHPESDPKRLFEILFSDEIYNLFFNILNAFKPDMAEKAEKLRKKIKEWEKIFDENNIKDPKDIIPRDKMAYIASLMFSETDDLTDRFISIIKRVTDGEGLNRVEVKRIINEIYPEHGYDFELDKGLKLLDTILSPVDPIKRSVAQNIMPLSEDHTYMSITDGIPSAKNIYDMISLKRDIPSGFEDIIPYLTLEQISYILKNSNKLNETVRNKLKYIKILKEEIKEIAKGFGSLKYVFQDNAISMLMADVVSKKEFLLGPEDISDLLKATLALLWHGSTVQVIHKLIFEYIKAQHDSFLLEVLVEMSENSARILSSILYAILNQDQKHLKEPLNMPDLFSEQLGINVPPRSDYMAGSKYARESYFNELMKVAEYIIENSKSYLAKKQHIQVRRYYPSIISETLTNSDTLINLAIEKIKEADNLGQQCVFTEKIEGPEYEAIQAYKNAFKACSDLLKKDAYAFYLPWFRNFWHRNYESLVILSIVRNYQEDIDNVRNWLHVRSGKNNFENEQELIDGVISSLYHFDEDKKSLSSDPLVRLLIDNPDGQYNFSIISCMGLITEGAKGTELDETFKRIEAKRGIKTIRADTKTLRSLEYNAKKIEEAISMVTTPWGYVGYSQGCANGLTAESMLLGGTPEQKKMLEGLRCRNLMFGAHNGSAHGTGSSEKFRRAIIDGEFILKHYQGVYSPFAIDLVLTAIKQTLDSQIVTELLGGAESVSHEACINLGRDGQFLGHVPTSTIKGVVFKAILPEALEFLGNVLTKQVDGDLHDTQVTLDATVGYPIFVEGHYTRVLKSCDIGSYAQSTHHWSPLLKEVEFITTQRDIELAIYDFPKDRHIFPWIEVNARFGNIE